MTPKNRRKIALICAALAALVICGVLVSAALKDNMLYFYSPSTAEAQHIPAGKAFRLGGLVAPGSVKRAGGALHFTVTDGKADMRVEFHGLPPALFAEGAGVVAEGRLGTDGIFTADRILARHDARYMPPDVVKALKQTGHWCDGAAATGKNCS